MAALDIAVASSLGYTKARTFFIACVSPNIELVQRVMGSTVIDAASSRAPIRRALLIGIDYGHGPVTMRLNGTHTDVDITRELLMAQYHFHLNDITILVDKPGTEDHMKPTRTNMLRELQALVQDPSPGGAYFVLYSGHGVQHDTHGDSVRKDEYLVPMDAVHEYSDDYLNDNLIMGDDLKRILVDPIAKVPKARLTVVFDCCHSGTVLDLCHHRCNRAYNLKSTYRRLCRRVKEVFPEPGETIQAFAEPWTILALEQVFLTMSIGHRKKKERSSKTCDGYCTRTRPIGGGNVLCISACKDSQSAFGNEEGGSLTTALVATLKEEPHPVLRELYRNVSHSVDSVIRKHVRSLFKSVSQNPQFSSLSPLHMKEVFVLQEPVD
ncbi:peptidase C14, caspase domain-containing protein [Armillaria novae-zelandiae]|uniref:Peptidase C14, caspase domain-containing protein n=1 Tax=Armillaria novae-zelandiae TaxID=153914 RepID=A0AA39UDH0_9AGAR|nr:peptidase C14, caspase domain-containing protein [Armillaria novae-zelandiae]